MGQQKMDRGSNKHPRHLKRNSTFMPAIKSTKSLDLECPFLPCRTLNKT